MAYNAKTNWKHDDPVTENDFNRMEQGIKDAHDGLVNKSNTDHTHPNATQTKTGFMSPVDKKTLDDLKVVVGNAADLDTETKANLVAAINELERKRAAHLADYAQFKSDITQEVSGARTSLINSHNSIAEM